MKKIAVIDSRADDKTIYTLEQNGLQVIPTMKIEKLYDAVATHADIQIHYLGNNLFICAPESFEHYKKYMPDTVTLIRGSMNIHSKYPYNIAYNVATLKNFVFCNVRYTAQEIIEEYKSMSKEILSVRQGYSKCNICVVNENSIITSDSGIAKVATEKEIDILKIECDHIKLRNMPYGFIGGATGLIADDVLAVNGNINTHSDGELIKQFCYDHNVELLELKNDVIEDIGTIIVNYDIE